MKKLLVAVMVFALSLPGLASALTYTPTVADLAAWTKLDGGSSTLNTFSKEDLSPFGINGVKFTGDLYPSGAGSSLPKQGYESIGINFSKPLDLSAYDTFALFVANQNESSWNYGLYVADNAWFMATSDPFLATIPKDQGATLKIDLAAMAAQGMDLQHIESMGLLIESDVVPMIIYRNGIPALDRTFETMVAPVPEPGTMMLLGAGFLGLAIYGKRRRNA